MYYLKASGQATVSNLPLFSKTFQGSDGRVSGKSGGIATTGRIRKPRTGDGRGRGKGSERGTQVNEKTLITGTKRSTGIAEVMTQTPCGLKMTLYSSVRDEHLLSPSQSQSLAELAPTSPPPSVPSTPRLWGCCCYLYDLNMLMHKWDRAHSATRLWPL